jgi:hypothetical protein
MPQRINDDTAKHDLTCQHIDYPSFAGEALTHLPFGKAFRGLQVHVAGHLYWIKTSP